MDTVARRQLLSLLGGDLAKVDLGIPLFDTRPYWRLWQAWWTCSDPIPVRARPRWRAAQHLAENADAYKR